MNSSMRSPSQRQERISKIAAFVRNHDESTASQAVLKRILGKEFHDINDKILSDLVCALNLADDQEVHACYSIIS